MGNLAPAIEKQRVFVPACAAGADFESVGATAPFTGTVTAVTHTTTTAITGADTDSRKIQVWNRGQAGAGTAAVAELAYAANVNTVAKVPKTVTLTSTAADLVVAEGDKIAAKSLHVGSTGLADPGGYVEITFTRS
jgi:hypothetical protein